MAHIPPTSDTTLHYLWTEEDGDGRVLILAIAVDADVVLLAEGAVVPYDSDAARKPCAP